MHGGLSVLGVEWMDVAKGLSGFLSGTGGLMQAGGSKAQAQLSRELAEKQRLDDERRRAEQSASNQRLIIGIGAAAAGTLGLALLLRR